MNRIDRVISSLNELYIDGVKYGVKWRADEIARTPDSIIWDKVTTSELVDLLNAMDKVLELRNKLYGR